MGTASLRREAGCGCNRFTSGAPGGPPALRNRVIGGPSSLAYLGALMRPPLLIPPPLMRPRHARRACALALLWLAFASPALATWHANEEIPVESPVYRLIEDLASSYAVPQGMLHIRPWTRAQLGEFLDKIEAGSALASKDPALQRLRRELEPLGGVEGLEPMLAGEEADASYEVSSYLRASYVEENARSTNTRDERVGLQASFAFGEHALIFADAYMGTITPGPHGTPDASGSYVSSATDVTTWYDRMYLTWQSRGFMVRAGHTWLDWGPGMSGNLGLSDGSPALDLAEAGVRLPGNARLQWFVSVLDPAAQTYLAGHRLEWRAGPSVEMGVAEYARFDGSGNVPLYMIPVVPFALIDRRVRSGTELNADSLGTLASNNTMYTADFSWTWRPGTRFYGELLVDDATRDNSRPLAIGWQAGAHLRRFMGRAAWSLRADYTRVYQYVYSTSNHLDFAFAGFPTGFPLGPDCDQFTSRLDWRPSPEWNWGIEWLVVRDGAQQIGDAWQPGDPVPANMVLSSPWEREQRTTFTADWSPSPSVTLSGAVGFSKILSLGHVELNDSDGANGRLQAALRW